MSPPSPARVFEIFGKSGVRKVFFDLTKRGVASPTELVFDLRLQPNQVHEALRELVAEQLVRRDEKGSAGLGEPWVFYSLTPDGVKLAESLQKTGLVP